jgi:mannose-6-phosphate isomerase-like protein (cupin superfamily)
MSREEIFVALAGRAVATLGRDVHKLEPGDALIVPPNQMFSLANEGEEEFVAVAVAPANVLACLPGGHCFQPPWVK